MFTLLSVSIKVFFVYLSNGNSYAHCNYTCVWLNFSKSSSFVIFLSSYFSLFLIFAQNIKGGNAIWVRCTINRSHSTPCKKAEFEHLQIFPGHCLDFFLSVSGKICHSPIKKVKRQPTLIISFSQHSPFFGEQSKNPG